jgi:sortase A
VYVGRTASVGSSSSATARAPADTGRFANRTPAAPLRPLARILIPQIDLDATVYSGITTRQFSRGVGHWPGTALPGRRGNTVLGAHRTSRPAPFADLDKLRPGDLITLVSAGRLHTYRVTRSFVVRPTATWITKRSATPTLTLFACHPKGSTSHRLVVRAVLTDPRLRTGKVLPFS